MTALVLALIAAVFAGLLRAILAGELRGLLSDRNHRAVEHAVSLLPSDLSEDIAAEWRAELTALEDADRLISAGRFSHSLLRAARAIANDSQPVSISVDQARRRGLPRSLVRRWVAVRVLVEEQRWERRALRDAVAAAEEAAAEMDRNGKRRLRWPS
ncbi:hypothetical protein [Baekduia sp. Peel2402]|uniref:hypothetical protein n=1 Tax=Baekduia sp. Peel2402 TaxID=3458296 RepID=UPI00403EB897